MICPDFDTLMKYLDGELQGERLREVSSHVDSCSECRRILDSQMRLEQAWRDDFVYPDETSFRAMEDEIYGRFRAGSGSFVKRTWKGILPVAAGIIAALIGVKLIVGTGPGLDRMSDVMRNRASSSEMMEGLPEDAAFDRVEDLENPVTADSLSTGLHWDSTCSDGAPAPVEESEVIVGFGSSSQDEVEDLCQDAGTVQEVSGAVEGAAGGSTSVSQTPEEVSDELPESTAGLLNETLSGEEAARGQYAENASTAGSPDQISEAFVECDDVFEESITEGYGMIADAFHEEQFQAGDQSGMDYYEAGEAEEQEEEVLLSLDADTTGLQSVQTVSPQSEICRAASDMRSDSADADAVHTRPIGPGLDMMFVSLGFDSLGIPDSTTRTLLDSLSPGWRDYIPFQFRDTVVVVPLAEVQDMIVRGHEATVETNQ
jgi:hypothetical protein